VAGSLKVYVPLVVKHASDVSFRIRPP
jgi:hypothetical protein